MSLTSLRQQAHTERLFPLPNRFYVLPSISVDSQICCWWRTYAAFAHELTHSKAACTLIQIPLSRRFCTTRQQIVLCEIGWLWWKLENTEPFRPLPGFRLAKRHQKSVPTMQSQVFCEFGHMDSHPTVGIETKWTDINTRYYGKWSFSIQSVMKKSTESGVLDK